MAERVTRKLKAEDEVENDAPAAPLSETKKVRRVRKVVPPQCIVSQPVPEQPTEAPPVVEAPEPAIPTDEPQEFKCMKCGCTLEAHTEECPICGERYVDLPKDLLAEHEKAEKNNSESLGELASDVEGDAPCVLSDADEGVIAFLEKDPKAFEVALICSECGTALEFAIDKCPLCGSDMENPDAGLVGLVSEMTFDGDASEEIDCPQCGARVRLAKGKCPECKESIMRSDPNGKSRRLDPVIHGDNVVFLHLDVEAGELSYLQRAIKKEGFEKQTIRLEAT